MVSKWWLSLIKIFSLTTSILSFLLVWLFYVDHTNTDGEKRSFIESCSIENVILLGFILIVTVVVYFLLMKSQSSLREKELFFRKYYGESTKGVIGILMIETTIFMVIAFVLSLVLIDQVAPLFNMLTEKSISLKKFESGGNFLMVFSFLILLGLVVGLLPSIWYARNRAVDILKKLQH